MWSSCDSFVSFVFVVLRMEPRASYMLHEQVTAPPLGHTLSHSCHPLITPTSLPAGDLLRQGSPGTPTSSPLPQRGPAWASLSLTHLPLLIPLPLGPRLPLCAMRQEGPGFPLKFRPHGAQLSLADRVRKATGLAVPVCGSLPGH